MPYMDPMGMLAMDLWLRSIGKEQSTPVSLIYCLIDSNLSHSRKRPEDLWMFVKYDSLILNLKIDKHLYFSLFKRPLLVILWMDDTWVNIPYNQVEVDNKTLNILLMEEILQTTWDLKKQGKSWDKLPTWTGDCRISEPSTVCISPGNNRLNLTTPDFTLHGRWRNWNVAINACRTGHYRRC